MNEYIPITYHIFITIILGVIGGITEFFPISSTCHIIILSKFFKFEINEIKILNSFIQFGTSLSILLYFKNTFSKLFYSCFIKKRKFTYKNNLSYSHILISTIPIIFMEIFVSKYIKFPFNSKNITFPIILGSILLTLSEIFKKKTKYKSKNISLLQSFIIGCFQCLALWPGFSRSCSTISIGILIGINQGKSTYFSYIISVPIFFGAMILDICKNIEIISLHTIPLLFISFLSSFITSSIFMQKYFKIISVCSFIPFIIYRLLLSFIIYLCIY
ncbi:MAG: undecaprenyl-diphosphate phosphatase [Buchnera aphidicola (Nurudea yanoniella)]